MHRPQYLTSLNEVYSGGSCNTCHIIAPGSGMRDFNGTGNPNGTYESRNNRTSGQRSQTERMEHVILTERWEWIIRTEQCCATYTEHYLRANLTTLQIPGAALIAIGAPSLSNPGQILCQQELKQLQGLKSWLHLLD